MFGSKKFCSNQVTALAQDVFAEYRGKVQSGIDEINANTEKLVSLETDLQGKLDAVRADIAKDKANVAVLEGKKEALDKLI